jgi:hypothetical protein
MLEWLRRNEIEIVAYTTMSILGCGVVISLIGIFKTGIQPWLLH